MAIWQVWAGGLAAILVLQTLAWAVSVVRHDVSLVERVWAPSFVLLAVVYAALGDGASSRTTLAVALVALWAAEVALHVRRRDRGRGEAPHYAAMRARRPDAFPVTSLLSVFWSHAGLAWVASLPLLAVSHRQAPEGLGWLDLLALLFWSLGLVLQVGSDRQAARFRRDPANRGRPVDVGVWRHTRAPREVGTVAVWWGLVLSAAATGAWWSALGAVVMTVVVLGTRRDAAAAPSVL